MSTIKNEEILLYCNFNKMIKGSGIELKTFRIELKTC